MLHDWKKRRFSRGGSTITQQMIKNVFLTKEKTLTRKLREYVLAIKAEEILNKHRILEIYLNEVEWGDNIYGIEAASRFYLDKHASELTPAEAALTAGMLPNPHYYNPFKRPAKARDRQERVLFNMQQAKLITQDEYAAALQEPVETAPGRLEQDGPLRAYGREGRTVLSPRARADAGFGYREQDLYHRGGTIRTTLENPLEYDFSNLGRVAEGRGGQAIGRIPVVIREQDTCNHLRRGQGSGSQNKTRIALGIFYESYNVGVIEADEIVSGADHLYCGRWEEVIRWIESLVVLVSSRHVELRRLCEWTLTDRCYEGRHLPQRMDGLLSRVHGSFLPIILALFCFCFIRLQ